MTENINQWQMIDGELINIDEYIFNSDAKDIDFNKILNIKELQLYQDVLFKAQKINAEVFDMKGCPVTRVTGDREDFEFLTNNIGIEKLEKFQKSIIDRGLNSHNVYWMDTEYVNIKCISIPILAGKTVIGIMALVVIYDKDIYIKKKSGKVIDTDKMKFITTEEQVKMSIDIVRMFINKIVKFSYSNMIVLQEIEENRKSKLAMNDELQRNEAFTKIVQLLEEDKNFEDIAQIVLEIVGEYLNVSSAMIIKKSTSDTCALVGEWNRDENNAFFKKITSIKPFVNRMLCEQELTYSTIDCNDDEIKDIILKSDNHAIMTYPIYISKRPAMYAVFADDDSNREWDNLTIRFVSDICKMIQSILCKKISTNSLVSSYSALKDILDNIGSALFVVDKSSKEILFCNSSMKRYHKSDLVGKHCCEIHFGEDDRNCEECKILKASSYFREVFDEEKQAWLEIRNNDITWVDGRLVSLAIITDVTENKKYQKRIEFQANNDFLTGLYNRMRCEEDLSVCIEEAIATGKSGALMFIDLDDFKHINDGLGHQYGDMLLKMISLGLQQIKGLEERCYRVGGDEFIIIVEPEQYKNMDNILANIKKLFCKAWYLNGTEYYCTMSMGIVNYPEDGEDVNDLLKKADIAMYDAKKSGKNRYEYYSTGEERSSVKRLDIEKNMRSAVAIGCEEFELFIQPIIDVKTKNCTGGEALIRWNSDNLGFLNPVDFIPLAEHLGLITPIGDYFLRKACIANRRWSDMGIDKRINVNLSVVQLLQNNAVEKIEDAIVSTGVKPENLVLEVTESLAINDMSRMKKKIKSIKELGVKIALDDFGTGYSSLNYIKQMALDIIKVDRTFVQDLVEDDYAQTFVKLITELSDKLDMKVCVEGIESIGQFEMLEKLNVALAQGYYFSRPIPLRQFEKEFLNIKE